MKGKIRKGRQRNNIKEWTGMDCASTTGTAEEKTRKGIVVNFGAPTTLQGYAND